MTDSKSGRGWRARLMTLWRPAVPEQRVIRLPEWSSDWDEATAEVAYRESLRIQEIQSQWSDSIDSKVAGVFAVASVIVTLYPFIHDTCKGFPGAPFWIASVFWLLGAACCYLAFRPRALEIGPSPGGLLHENWMGLTPNEFRLCRMSEMGDSYEFNKATLDTKATWLKRGLLFTILEVTTLLTALARNNG